YACIDPQKLNKLTSIAKYVHEVANQVAPNNQPFVGQSAFAHKGGMHVSAVLKDARTYEHIEPELVGNSRRVLVSELSGQGNLVFKANEWNYKIDKTNPASKKLLETIKEKEHAG